VDRTHHRLIGIAGCCAQPPSANDAACGCRTVNRTLQTQGKIPRFSRGRYDRPSDDRPNCTGSLVLFDPFFLGRNLTPCECRNLHLFRLHTRGVAWQAAHSQLCAPQLTGAEPRDPRIKAANMLFRQTPLPSLKTEEVQGGRPQTHHL